MSTEHDKVSVTLPSGLLEQIRRRVGVRGLSGHVAHALQEEERRSALRAWLTDREAEHGPIPAQMMEEVRHEWLGDAPADH